MEFINKKDQSWQAGRLIGRDKENVSIMEIWPADWLL
jgi:hypothetical protein